MPIDYKKYPSDWKAIRARILERDGHKCKRCGVANHAYGGRDSYGIFYECTPENVMDDAFWETKRGVVIVLTIAHTCTCVPKCGIDEHLEALCQRCHLLLDLPHHIRKRRATLKGRKAAADLFPIDSQLLTHSLTKE